MSLKTAYETLEAAANNCAECGLCTPDCEVLSTCGEGVSVGEVAREFVNACGNTSNLESDVNSEAYAAVLQSIATFAQSRPELIFAVRRCCMCGHCTTHCEFGVDARCVFTVLRELFTLSGVVSETDFKSTQMDNEWHIFSVYRAVHGIYYTDLPHVENARENNSDTLFFPGCPLVSYGSELTREIFNWLQAEGFNAVISEDCCGSPFKSAGRIERGNIFKANLLNSFKDAGIKKVVCVCPGCVEEFESVEESAELEFVPLPKLLLEKAYEVKPEKILAYAQQSSANAGVASASDVRISIFDSCHDRNGRFANILRQLLNEYILAELPHCGQDAICCGAAGSVSLVDPDICARRAHRVLDEETQAAHSQLLVANCPTCSYTWASQRRTDAQTKDISASVPHANYLDLFFNASFDWDTAFSQLESMWSGEYGSWVCQQLL